jgi:hypothetical protein
VGYIAETLTCQADQLVPVPPSIPRARKRGVRCQGTPPLLSDGSVIAESLIGHTSGTADESTDLGTSVPR